ncbi:MAG: hypothetical protein KH387_09915 [Parabacteroides goldsteinii]|nr:hypothetical protein [Parabacteroides goldsteinii]
MNKCFLVTFLLCVISHYSLPAQPDSLLISHKIDSLKSLVAASVDPHVTIPLLTSLADLTNQTPAEIGWLEPPFISPCSICRAIIIMNTGNGIVSCIGEGRSIRSVKAGTNILTPCSM